MSRIDEALRLSEGAGPEPEQGTGGKAAGPPLNQYPRERRGRGGSDEPRGPRPVDTEDFAGDVGHRAGDQPGPAPDDALLARLVTGTSNSVAAEQYRRLAAVLHEEQADDALTTVMVTSAIPGEGKTLTAVNLALTLSESYARRVLVIDADLRAPSVHTTLGVPNDAGLSDALRDGDGPLPIRQVTTGLSVMTAGRTGSNPLAGLSSRRMEEILIDLSARFDWVLLDASPVGVLSDAQVLARLVGGVIFVIGAGSTPAAAVERAIAELGGSEAIIGTVLNRIEEHRIPDAAYRGRYGHGNGR
jgi:capsular exopolysaccharide synthesis family protein